MKNILSILLISVSFIGCSEKVQRYHVDEATSPNDKLTYLKKDMSLVSGIVFDTVYNGQLADEGNYKDGKEDGLFKSWYKNGQLADKGNFIDGKLILGKCWDNEGNEIECEN